ncbi:Ig-like domain-containing protein [Pseudocitrobacter faecalis]
MATTPSWRPGHKRRTIRFLASNLPWIPPSHSPSGLTPSADGTYLSGKAEPGSEVIIRDAGGKEIGKGTADASGSFNITLNPAQITGAPLTATASDSAGISARRAKCSP